METLLNVLIGKKIVGISILLTKVCLTLEGKEGEMFTLCFFARVSGFRSPFFVVEVNGEKVKDSEA